MARLHAAALTGAGCREFDTIADWAALQIVNCRSARPMIKETVHAIVPRG
jgi:hypothetical protein